MVQKVHEEDVVFSHFPFAETGDSPIVSGLRSNRNQASRSKLFLKYVIYFVGILCRSCKICHDKIRDVQNYF